MKKRIFKVLAVAAFTMVAGYNVYQSNNETEGMSELMLANVEAIAYGENIQLQCDGGSIVVKCQRTCFQCFRTWVATNGYGKAVGIRGKCLCGASY